MRDDDEFQGEDVDEDESAEEEEEEEDDDDEDKADGTNGQVNGLETEDADDDSTPDLPHNSASLGVKMHVETN